MYFYDGADWYSEGLFTTPFLPVYRGDELAESYTHADVIIGNITVGRGGRADIRLREPCDQFIVLEAKLFSRLSASTTRAPGYNQVARNIACMAGVAESSGCSINNFRSLGFYVLAPSVQLKQEPSYRQFIEKESVYQHVQARVESYKGRSDYVAKRNWFEEYFEPLLERIDMTLISWEEIIESISSDYLTINRKRLKMGRFPQVPWKNLVRTNLKNSSSFLKNTDVEKIIICKLIRDTLMIG